jgi:methylthioribose-1-phosphate isomerase
MYLAALHAPRGSREGFLAHLEAAGEVLRATRPTAVNLAWAVARVLEAVRAGGTARERLELAKRTAQAIADEDAEACRRIGEHGLGLIREVARRKGGAAVNVLTHCNAGWLAFVDYGSATAPLYAAFDAGIPVHVWVDETRPRNQGAKLTAWELREHGVPHTVVTDNAGGHLMQRGLVDLVLVGSDRTTRTGDVANKIGTYLKALAAADNSVPFYVALPSSTFDWTMRDGVKEIPIEERGAEEVTHISGQLQSGEVARVRLTPEGSAAANYGFDVTPARLVTGLVTERGVCRAEEGDILRLFPERDVRELRPA